jgi:hypothetical protein
MFCNSSKFQKQGCSILIIPIAGLMLAACVPAVFAEEKPDESSGWHFRAAPYLWMVALNGDVTVKGQETIIRIVSDGYRLIFVFNDKDTGYRSEDFLIIGRHSRLDIDEHRRIDKGSRKLGAISPQEELRALPYRFLNLCQHLLRLSLTRHGGNI